MIAKLLKLLLLALLVASLEGNYYQYKLYTELLPMAEELKEELDLSVYTQEGINIQLFSLANYAVQEVRQNTAVLVNLKEGNVIRIEIKDNNE